jgi:hypothetical protein
MNKLKPPPEIAQFFGRTLLLVSIVFAVNWGSTKIAFAQVQYGSGSTSDVEIKTVIDFPINAMSHVPVIEAKVNGRGPYRFALDTGFGGTVGVTPSVAAQLEMPLIGEVRTGDPSRRNPQTAPLYRADLIDIGSLHFKDISVSEIAGRGNLSGTDGIIGLRLFHGFAAKLDYVNRRFELQSGALSVDTSLPYSTDHGVPSIEIRINEFNAKVDVDSGSPSEVSLPLSLAKTLNLFEEPRVVGHGRTMDGEFDVYGATLNGDVRVGDIVLSNPRLSFVAIFPNGNIGYRFLKNLIVTFDPANRRVRFQKAS